MYKLHIKITKSAKVSFGEHSGTDPPNSLSQMIFEPKGQNRSYCTFLDFFGS